MAELMSRVKLFLTALGLFVVGVVLTVAVFSFALRTNLGIWTLLPLWLLVLSGGTSILPSSITAPYDPVGHPLLHLLGILANGVYFGLLIFGICIVIKRIYGRRSKAAI